MNIAHAFDLCLAQLRAQAMFKDTVPDCDGWCREYEDSPQIEFETCMEGDGTIIKITDRFSFSKTSNPYLTKEEEKEEKMKEEQEKRELEKWLDEMESVAITTVNPKYGRIVIAGDSGCSLHRETFIKGLQEQLNTTIENNCVCSATITDIMTKEKACSHYKDCQWSVIMDNGANGQAGPEDMERFVERELKAGKKVLINGGVSPQWVETYAAYKKIAEKYRSTGKMWYVDTQSNPKFDPNDKKFFSGHHPSEFVVKEIFVPAMAKVIKTHS